MRGHTPTPIDNLERRRRGELGHRQQRHGDDADRQAYLRVTREFGSDNRTFVYVRDGKGNAAVANIPLQGK